MKLDKIDIEILELLSADGRRSFTEIAEQLKVSVGTVRNRYTAMVEANILHIIGWTDPTQTGMNAYARVNIKVRPTHYTAAVTKALMQLKYISFLASTSGEYDLEVNIMCGSNKELIHVVNEEIHTIEGIDETNTTIYFEVHKWASQIVNKN